MFNNNFEFRVLKEKKDLNGNYLALDIVIEKQRLTLLSLYGPNTDSPVFFTEIMNVIEDLGNDYFILCGDFNLVLNPHIDYYNYLHVNNPNARDKLLEIIDQYCLVDPFRELSPELQRYTWRKKTPFKQARLDFFLFSESLLPNLRKCTIESSYRSDHSMVVLELEFNPFIRGKGLWKFNNSLLYDVNYVTLIKEKILEVKKQYGALVYNFENIHEVCDENLHFTINSQLFLETLLLEIRGKTISYSSYKKKEKEKQENVLMQEIESLEALLDENSIQNLESKKQELETIRKEKMRGKIVRSRVKWIEEGEKPSKYFCGLESRNFTSKIIPKVEREDGQIITNQKDILMETKLFYETLYKDRDCSGNGCKITDLETDLKNLDFQKLTLEEQMSLEGEITASEASITLQKMNNNRSPGSDGFSTEFFKFFWKDLKFFVVESLNYGFKVGELSVTQKQGIITCLPKDKKPRHFLKNWRPISLLNTVYKIGSGVIANRLKKVLNKLIDLDQTGFISGRYIGDNIRLIYDIMQFTEENDIPGLLLLIDFEKAFDSISWNFLLCVMKFFNFGESIINWVQVFYKNITSAIIQGGNLSDFFRIGRGCRQGDPLSPYLFILCAEILAIKIRGNKTINGIKITRVEHKLSQFADDTSLILDGSEESLNEALLELDWYAKLSGLNINFSKTQVVWIGSKKYSRDILCPNRNLSWGKTTFKLLGINFDVNLDKIIDINYTDRMLQIKNLIHTWSKRNLTCIGKITVVKTLILPVINHLILTLPNPSNEIIKKINDLLFTFIWNSPVHRVKKEVLQKDYSEGGLKMINLASFIIALKSTWVRKLFSTECKWQNILLSKVDKEKIFQLGNGYSFNIIKQNITNRFWCDVFNAWQMIVDKEDNNDWDYFLSSPIWMNKNIKIDNKPIFYRDWFNKGICYVNDIVNEDGKFLSFEKLKEIFCINANVMKYNSIISALKQAEKKYVSGNFKLTTPFIPSFVKTILRKKKGTKDMYLVLIRNNIVSSGQRKWDNIFDLDESEWTDIFKLPFIVTKNTKLQWLQYRINQYILATNKFLHKINVINEPNCTFCQEEVETIEHLFWNCDVVQSLIEEVDSWFLSNGISIPFTKKNFLFGDFSKLSKGDKFNLIFLRIKQYIYNCRYFKKKLSLQAVQKAIKDLYGIEKQIAVKNHKLDDFNKMWNSFIGLL